MGLACWQGFMSDEGKKIEAAAVYRNYLQVFPNDLRIERDLAARLLLDEGLYDQAFSNSQAIIPSLKPVD